MEQQKILWIILSVAVLLLVVLGSALFMFSPPAGGETGDTAIASAREITPEEFDPIEWARSSEEYPGIVEEKKDVEGDEFVVVYGETGEKAEPEAVAEKIPEAIPVKEVSVKEVVKKAEPLPQPVKPAPKPVVREVPKKVNVTEYWIQTGSFKSVTSAENAKQTLVSKGLAPTVQTKTVSGTDYYRVRLGPYESKEEAEKFLGWVKGIDGFIESYVSKVYSQR